MFILVISFLQLFAFCVLSIQPNFGESFVICFTLLCIYAHSGIFEFLRGRPFQRPRGGVRNTDESKSSTRHVEFGPMVSAGHFFHEMVSPNSGLAYGLYGLYLSICMSIMLVHCIDIQTHDQSNNDACYLGSAVLTHQKC